MTQLVTNFLFIGLLNALNFDGFIYTERESCKHLPFMDLMKLFPVHIITVSYIVLITGAEKWENRRQTIKKPIGMV